MKLIDAGSQNLSLEKSSAASAADTIDSGGMKRRTSVNKTNFLSLEKSTAASAADTTDSARTRRRKSVKKTTDTSPKCGDVFSCICVWHNVDSGRTKRRTSVNKTNFLSLENSSAAFAAHTVDSGRTRRRTSVNKTNDASPKFEEVLQLHLRLTPWTLEGRKDGNL